MPFTVPSQLISPEAQGGMYGVGLYPSTEMDVAGLVVVAGFQMPTVRIEEALVGAVLASNSKVNMVFQRMECATDSLAAAGHDHVSTPPVFVDVHGSFDAVSPEWLNGEKAVMFVTVTLGSTGTEK